MMQLEVSSSLIYHVRTMIDYYIAENCRGNIKQYYSWVINLHAFPAYFSAVASVETFINEMFLSDESQNFLPSAPLWLTPIKELENLSTLEKLEKVPKELFGETFVKGIQPYQDMNTLIKVRNYLIHHKSSQPEPKFLKGLIDRSIIPGDWGLPGSSTVIKLSSITGVVWAYNTACKTMATLLAFATPHYQDPKFDEWFAPLPDDYVETRFRNRNT